ncbi:phenylalanine--tRNA ligase subunit beta [Anoxynatronum buryatiense]|uniref:Phenylalanine--tRNA ligase beta subunit n=1 Tax=Anoxynatronum buryatiense TaxID=489973 RepID=A0AA45WTW3_9CLOT|nr:phenylalanine--tRNA ligase subunit beta [Anoxynatronum buryatiense]SMP40680.1 phenylalanyl-tRNA synthetase beta subunit [Anoxynatronum buryatiense]
MLVPVKWLEEYVTLSMDTKEFADQMTMSGSKVEEVRNWGENLEKLVIGKILSIQPHPNADKLVVTHLDIGEEKPLQIVTGATNIKEGDTVPVALEGTTLPNGVTIVGEDLRGEASQGMMCSHDELGITKNLIPESMKDGIWILDEKTPGSRFIDALPAVDQIIEFEITSNRPDCMSVIGIAREAAATVGETLKVPAITLEEAGTDWTDTASVRIDDPEGCRRYVARKVENIVIRQSPQWLQQRLMQAGVRPINNVVDVTNYVMLEMGQPLHAFDAAIVARQSIVVRRAKPDETTKTLDGTLRKLNDQMTLITDSEKVLGIAGVMGGENSEVTTETRAIILESACFNADRIRKTSQQLGLRTEASARFEKGQDPELSLMAANRACQLLEELEAGQVCPGVIDVYPQPATPRENTLRPHRVNALLGTDLKVSEMVEILHALEIKAHEADELIHITVPTFRDDLVQEADFIEEIGRIYGYDKIKATLMTGDIMVGGLSHRQKMEEVLKRTMSGLGCYEAATYSFVSPSGVDLIRLPEDSFKRDFVRLLNPLGDETSVMRTTLLPNMMEVLRRNVSRSVPAGSFYEIGQVFYGQLDEAKAVLPLEVKELVMGIYGEGNDFFVLKGMLIHLFKTLGLASPDFERESNHPTFHPGRCANIYVGDQLMGTLGEIHPLVAANYDMDDVRVFVAEINGDAVLAMAKIDPLYKPLPRYPAVVRDLAVVVDKMLSVQTIEILIRRQAGELLEDCRLFDVYQGAQVGENQKSVAYTLTFRHNERTLKDKEVNQCYDAVVSSLKKELNAVLRA